jgi:hypothetical protein
MAGRLDDVGLLDQHCHGIWPQPLSRTAFEAGLTESADPPPAGTTRFDSALGLAVRRWCAPVLDLPAHAPAGDDLARRGELGPPEVARRLLTAARLDGLLVDGGHRPDELLGPTALGGLAAAPAREVVRLETVAERLVAAGAGPAELVAGYPEALRAAVRAVDAVAVKTVAAYRVGLDLPANPPGGAELGAAARRWYARQPDPAQPRLDDPLLLRFVVEHGLRLGLPLQVHAGFGDPDLTLHRSDPALLTGLLRVAPAPVVLLHNYPYHRQAAYLAHAFPHVYLDVGLAVPHTGARAAAVLAEVLELAPFGQLLYSSDGFGLPELHFLGATLFRRGLSAVLTGLVELREWAPADADRVARMIGSGNARRLYRLDPSHSP